MRGFMAASRSWYHRGMTGHRKRRIVRRAALALGIVALLVSGYVSAFAGVRWAAIHGHLSHSAKFTPVFDPLWAYTASELPGARAFDAFVAWCSYGGRVPYGDVRETLDWLRDKRSLHNDRSRRSTDGDK